MISDVKYINGILYYEYKGKYYPIRLPIITVGGGGGGRGATGPTGPQGPSNIFANALFVDAVYGNDTNAVPFSFMDSTTNAASHKYQSPEAARDAANAGDVIIIYPGDYTVLSNLYKNGVTYYLYPGVNLNANIADPSGLYMPNALGETCNVFGYGNLYNNHESGGGTSPVLGAYVKGSLYVRCNNIRGWGNPIICNCGILDIVCNDILNTNDDSTINFAGNPTQQTGNVFNLICNTIRNTTSVSAGGGINGGVTVATGVGQGWNGKIYIKCNQLIGSPSNTSNLIYVSNKCTGADADHKCEILVEARELIPLTLTSTNRLVGILNNTFTKFTLKANCNLIGTARPVIVTQPTNSNNENIFEGNYTSDTGVVASFSASNEINRMNGTFISNNTSNTIISSAATSKLFIDGTIQNTTGTGAGINKAAVSPGNDLIIGNAKIITAGGLPVSAGGADTLKVIHSLAMNNVSSPVAAALNSIVGSTCYSDAGVE